MRVLQVNKFFYPRAGAETVFLQTRDLLRAEGQDVIDFAMRHPDNLQSPYAPYFAAERSYEPDGGAIRRTRDAVSSVYSLQARRALARLLDVYRPDVAHLHNVYHQLTLSLVDELEARRIPIVLTLHDWKIACPAYTLFTEGAPCRRCPSGSVLNAIRHRCVKGSTAASVLAAGEAALARRRGTYGKVQRVITPSRFGAAVAQLAGIHPERIDYVPNFLPDEELAGSAPTVDYGPRFLYVGRLDKLKGIRPMLAAFSLVRAPASLRIVGSGELEQEVRSAAARDSRIEYVGPLPRAQVYEELERTRAVVIPSLVEDNAPLVLLEAQAKAKATIVTHRGGLPELVRDGETGLVVDPEDLESHAAAMERMALDVESAREWGRRAQQRVREEHSADRHYERLCSVYSTAISEIQSLSHSKW